MSARDEVLISTEALEKALASPDLITVDASWYLPTMGRDAAKEYRARRIPGAVFFDIDEISDPNSSLPHMIPPAHVFASKMRKLGIGDGKRIVVYDGYGFLSAPRVWWMLKTMGARDVAVLDGGFPKWESEGRPIDDLPPVPRDERHFTARLDNTAISNADAVGAALATGRAHVIDARPAARFRGEAEEPRPGVRSGHMPGSANLPFDGLVNADGTLKSDEDLRSAFESAGWEPGKKVITSCGSGVTAAILTMALTILGEKNLTLYDGSWAEWGADEERPIGSAL